ncbi:GGDEF domain-containing protein [Parahaliea mediterranea]|uniref:diguanylate cyclase n=1 Tax=Parahaliea mediterranea TaxID=651086 RepID=A0A939ILD8_9GAMM|nr:GGDEF domain-containing protein [Parahaliea mediterranea]MBN7795857.1 GGDEF domain-containing protein [Parahaliea mediterranea]
MDTQTAAAVSGALLGLVLTAASMQLKGFGGQTAARPMFRAFFLLVSLYLLLLTVAIRRDGPALALLLDLVFATCHSLFILGVIRRSERPFPRGVIVLWGALYLAVSATAASYRVQVGLLYSASVFLLGATLLLYRRGGANLGDRGMAITAIAWSASCLFSIFGLGKPDDASPQLTLSLIFALPVVTALAVCLFLSYVLDDREDLRNQAARDALTEIHNRRYLFERAADIFSLMRRQHTPVSLIMLDVDHFKWINDRLGHATGDQALRAIARSLTQDSRLEDVVARMGGEEFAVLMPNTTLPEAMAKAERLRRGIEAIRIPGAESEHISASFGVVNGEPADRPNLETMLQRADEAMYRAKAAGRNTIAQAELGKADSGTLGQRH